VIGRCHHCATDSETYYNCANMDCNELFLCCESCLKAHVGCCCHECQEAPRLRPYKLSAKPFRRWYHYADTKEALYQLAGKDVPQREEPL